MNGEIDEMLAVYIFTAQMCQQVSYQSKLDIRCKLFGTVLKYISLYRPVMVSGYFADHVLSGCFAT